MADSASVLDKLRPFRPPAPDGTTDIVLMALVGCVAAAALAFAIHHVVVRRRRVRRAALAALEASRVLPAQQRLAAQARLLRDIAQALDSGGGALRGDAWLARLDALFATQFFSEGPGRAFGDALYQSRDDDPTQLLDDEITRLLARLRT